MQDVTSLQYIMIWKGSTDAMEIKFLPALVPSWQKIFISPEFYQQIANIE